MSFSNCKRCNNIVDGHEKYCGRCCKKFPVLQDVYYWRLPEKERELHDKVESCLHHLNCDNSLYDGFVVLMNMIFLPKKDEVK